MSRTALTISLMVTLISGSAISGCTANLSPNITPPAACPVCKPTPPCAGWRAIYPSREDVLTRGTKEAILAHNEYGVSQKCWSAP